jgi:hypothetical protein
MKIKQKTSFSQQEYARYVISISIVFKTFRKRIEME